MMGDVIGEIMNKPYDLLLGRRTYDITQALASPDVSGGCQRSDAVLNGVLNRGPDRRTN
jgi:hypothetical protein